MADGGGTQSEPDNHRARIAGGAGYAFLGRMGAFIEAFSVIAFTWFYGAATFGLFAVLWSYVKVSTAFSDVAMATALQRFVPPAKGTDAEKVTGYALKLSFLIACAIALASTLLAPKLAPFINAAESEAIRLTTIIQIYVWVLPFWTLVEVATAAIRARCIFGPEIRVRILYEQGIRLIAAIAFALAGMLSYGLFLAHLISVVLAAGLALRLVAKHYDMVEILRAPMSGPIARDMRKYGYAVMPANVIKGLFSEFPVMFLNFMLPGAAGAAAGGYYSVARKIASALQTVRMTFEYVMAPLAAEREGHGDRAALRDMYHYATRLSICVALPFAAAIILARSDILAAMKPEFQVAATAIAILCAGRVFEAATGPSSAIIEMLGHRLLPPLNSLLGLTTLLALGFYLIPLYGVNGAAIAASIGLNVTAVLSLVEAGLLFKILPYDRQLFRPLMLALLMTTVIICMVPFSTQWPAPTGILIAIASLLAALMLLVRYGLNDTDAAALGKIGRRLRPAPQKDNPQ